MRKLFSLFLNEMLKIRKKVAVLVLVIVMTVGMAGCSAIFKVFSVVENYTINATDTTDYIELEEYFKDEIKKFEENPDEIEYDKSQYHSLKIEYNKCYLNGSFTKENNITKGSYRFTVKEEMHNLYNIMLSEELYNYDEGKESKEYKKAKEQYDIYENIIKSGDFKQYISCKIKFIEEANLSEEEKISSIKFYKELYNYCPTGEFGSESKEGELYNLINEKCEIEEKLSKFNKEENDSNSKTKKELETQLKVINAKLENDIYYGSTSEQNQGNSFSMSFSLGTLFSIIILIILAGAMMSGETSTGTIKSLIIAPVKRWKIYTAKYLALITMMIIFTAYIYIVSAVINILFFGYSSFGNEVYIVFGEVIIINYLMAQLIYAICSMVPLLLFTTFAYMLSIVTKNTAVSVSLSIGAYLGGSLVHTILMGFLSERGYITKFLPFNNTEWFNMIFESTSDSDISITSLMGGNIFESPSSLGFSIIYIVVLLVCMNWIARDSFCKNDIK